MKNTHDLKKDLFHNGPQSVFHLQPSSSRRCYHRCYICDPPPLPPLLPLIPLLPLLPSQYILLLCTGHWVVFTSCSYAAQNTQQSNERIRDDDNDNDDNDEEEDKYNEAYEDTGRGRGTRTMRDEDEVEIEDEDDSMIG